MSINTSAPAASRAASGQPQLQTSAADLATLAHQLGWFDSESLRMDELLHAAQHLGLKSKRRTIRGDFKTSNVQSNWTITRSISTDANGVKLYTSTYNGVEFSAPTAGGDDTIYAGAMLSSWSRFDAASIGTLGFVLWGKDNYGASNDAFTQERMAA